MNVASSFPAPLRDAAQTAVRSAFVTGLHRGSLVAAGTALAAALVALVFVPARPVAGGAGAGKTGPRPNGGGGLPPVHDPEQRLSASRNNGRAGSLMRPGPHQLAASAWPSRGPKAVIASASLACALR